MGPEDAYRGRREHHGSQILLCLYIEVRQMSEKYHDDVLKEEPILILLRPHRAPWEEMAVRLRDDRYLNPLIAADGIDGEPSEVPEVTCDGDYEPECGENIDESRVHP